MLILFVYKHVVFSLSLRRGGLHRCLYTCNTLLFVLQFTQLVVHLRVHAIYTAFLASLRNSGVVITAFRHHSKHLGVNFSVNEVVHYLEHITDNLFCRVFVKTKFCGLC